jgi:hypothetical protein
LIEDGNSDLIDQGEGLKKLINYPKFDMISKVIKGYLQFNTKHNELGL